MNNSTVKFRKSSTKGSQFNTRRSTSNQLRQSVFDINALQLGLVTAGKSSTKKQSVTSFRQDTNQLQADQQEKRDFLDVKHQNQSLRYNSYMNSGTPTEIKLKKQQRHFASVIDHKVKTYDEDKDRNIAYDYFFNSEPFTETNALYENSEFVKINNQQKGKKLSKIIKSHGPFHFEYHLLTVFEYEKHADIFSSSENKILWTIKKNGMKLKICYNKIKFLKDEFQDVKQRKRQNKTAYYTFDAVVLYSPDTGKIQFHDKEYFEQGQHTKDIKKYSCNKLAELYQKEKQLKNNEQEIIQVMFLPANYILIFDVEGRKLYYNNLKHHQHCIQQMRLNLQENGVAMGLVARNLIMILTTKENSTILSLYKLRYENNSSDLKKKQEMNMNVMKLQAEESIVFHEKIDISEKFIAWYIKSEDLIIIKNPRVGLDQGAGGYGFIILDLIEKQIQDINDLMTAHTPLQVFMPQPETLFLSCLYTTQKNGRQNIVILKLQERRIILNSIFPDFKIGNKAIVPDGSHINENGVVVFTNNSVVYQEDTLVSSRYSLNKMILEYEMEGFQELEVKLSKKEEIEIEKEQEETEKKDRKLSNLIQIDKKQKEISGCFKTQVIKLLLFQDKVFALTTDQVTIFDTLLESNQKFIGKVIYNNEEKLNESNWEQRHKKDILDAMVIPDDTKNLTDNRKKGVDRIGQLVIIYEANIQVWEISKSFTLNRRLKNYNYPLIRVEISDDSHFLFVITDNEQPGFKMIPKIKIYKTMKNFDEAPTPGQIWGFLKYQNIISIKSYSDGNNFNYILVNIDNQRYQFAKYKWNAYGDGALTQQFLTQYPKLKYLEETIFVSQNFHYLATPVLYYETFNEVGQKIILWDNKLGYLYDDLKCNLARYGFQNYVEFIQNDTMVITASKKMILVWDFTSKTIQKVISDYNEHFIYIEPLYKLILFDQNNHNLVYRNFTFPETYFNAKWLDITTFFESKYLDKYSKNKMFDIFIFPIETSFMHCLVQRRKTEKLQTYLDYYKGSLTLDMYRHYPIQVALDSKARKCVDILLLQMVDLPKTRLKNRTSLVAEITENAEDLQPKTLVKFLDSFFETPNTFTVTLRGKDGLPEETSYEKPEYAYLQEAEDEEEQEEKTIIGYSHSTMTEDEYRKAFASGVNDITTTKTKIEIKMLNIPEVLDQKHKIIENLIMLKDDDVILSEFLDVTMSFKQQKYADGNIFFSSVLYIILLLLFCFYELFFFGAEGDICDSFCHRRMIPAKVIKWICILISIYFVWRRIYLYQIFEQQKEKGWFYCDVFLFLLMSSSILYDEYECANYKGHQQSPVLLWIYSVGGFTMWLRIIYLLRVNEEFGRFVYLISKTVVDMQIFFVLLVFIIFAFSHPFYLGKGAKATSTAVWESDDVEVSSENFVELSCNNKTSNVWCFTEVKTVYQLCTNQVIKKQFDDGKIATEYVTQSLKVCDSWLQLNSKGIYQFVQEILTTYTMILGENPYPNYEKLYLKNLYLVMFFLCTFVLVVTLFNLLIAIMSTTYAEVSEVMDSKSKQEKYEMIMMEGAIGKFTRKDIGDEDLTPTYLFFSQRDKGDDMNEAEKQQEEIEKEIQVQAKKLEDDIDDEQRENEKAMSKLGVEFSSIQKDDSIDLLKEGLDKVEASHNQIEEELVGALVKLRQAIINKAEQCGEVLSENISIE